MAVQHPNPSYIHIHHQPFVTQRSLLFLCYTRRRTCHLHHSSSSFSSSSCSSVTQEEEEEEHVTTLCSGTRYPSLCVRTLTTPPLPQTTTPTDLAIAAVSASLTLAKSTSTYIASLRSPLPVTLLDCRDQISDAADQLSKTAAELSRLRPQTFRWQMDNALTWVSAAMTNADTCFDGVKQKQSGRRTAVEKDVVSRVTGVENVSSVALYFLDRLKRSSKGRRGS